MAITGKVSQVIGPVVDVAFQSDNELPNILDSLEVVKPDGSMWCSKETDHSYYEIIKIEDSE